MYVVVACENRRIFRLLLCFDLPFLRFKILRFSWISQTVLWNSRTELINSVGFLYKAPRSSWLFPNTVSLFLDTGTRSSQSEQCFSVCKNFFRSSIARVYHLSILSWFLIGRCWNKACDVREVVFRLGFADGIFRRRKATGGKSVCFRRLHLQ